MILAAVYSALLGLTLPLVPVRSHDALRSKLLFPQKTCNDSAQYYLDASKTRKARGWIDRALTSTDSSPAEEARTWLLSGDLEEVEGFTAVALSAYRRSKKLAQGSRAFTTEASAGIGMANTLVTLGQYDSVLVYLDESRSLDAANLQNDLVQARYWQSLNQQDKALTLFQKAYESATRLNDRRIMALALSGTGTIYFGSSDMKHAIAQFEKALTLFDSSKQFNMIARTFGRLANAHMVIGKTKEAAGYLARARKIIDLSDNLPVRGYILSSLSILKSEEGDIPGAIEYAKEPIQIKRKLGLLRQLQGDLLNVSDLYMSQRHYGKARELIDEGKRVAASLKDVTYLGYFYNRASTLDSIEGHFQSAYSNLRRSMTFKDSAVSLQRMKAIEDIREKYQTEQKEKTIAEKEVVIQQQKYQQSVIIGASSIAVLLLGVILIVLRNRHRIRIEREKQQQNHLRLQTIVNTQEEVQQSIARDLHDGLVQLLGAAKMSLQAIPAQGDNTLVFDRVKESSKIMDEATAEARNISHQILPYSLMKDGLVPALTELFARSLTQWEFKKPGEAIRLAGEIEINVYRICQEIVNNIVKHAEATSVDVALEATGGQLALHIRDNGRGFEYRPQTQGVGLTNILTRAALIGGTLEIHSAPGSGTSVQLSVPL